MKQTVIKLETGYETYIHENDIVIFFLELSEAFEPIYDSVDVELFRVEPRPCIGCGERARRAREMSEYRVQNGFQVKSAKLTEGEESGN